MVEAKQDNISQEAQETRPSDLYNMISEMYGNTSIADLIEAPSNSGKQLSVLREIFTRLPVR